MADGHVGLIDRMLDSGTDRQSLGESDRPPFEYEPGRCFRDYLRANAAGANLNREWKEPSLERSPEVFHMLRRMNETGFSMCLDAHGGELLYNFIAV